MDFANSALAPTKIRDSEEIPSGDCACVDKWGDKKLAAAKSETIPLCKSLRSANITKEESRLISVKKSPSNQFPNEYNDENKNRHHDVKSKALAGVDNDFGQQMNQFVIQAALGGCRWPPYLLLVWVVLLVLSHTLHCLVTILAQVLPYLKQFSVFLRGWTEEAWCDKTQAYRHANGAALAATTAFAYLLYLALYAAHALVVWFLEPLACGGCAGADRAADRERSGADIALGHYDDIVNCV